MLAGKVFGSRVTGTASHENLVNNGEEEEQIIAEEHQFPIVYLYNTIGEVPLSHPVKSANIRFFRTFDLRQIRLKEQCVLIYTKQCCKNHTKNCIDPNFWFVFEHTET